MYTNETKSDVFLGCVFLISAIVCGVDFAIRGDITKNPLPIAAVSAGLSIIMFTQALRLTSRLAYINNYTFHPGIKSKLKRKHPDLDDTALDLVFQGLRDYLFICSVASHRYKGERKMVSMPSRIVDDAWHEFILFTREYGDFCEKALGRFLHHTPAEAMASSVSAQGGIKRAWLLACKKAGIDPKKPAGLPVLFSLDKQLAIAGGFTYSLDCLAAGNEGDQGFCVNDIGCGGGSGCGGGDGGCSGDGGCGGGCGGGGD